ncbi:hypothetical protein [Paracoccus yeei]|uniref:hypothetical protein n=1 Tax=Paracoccus yeei TaxID=147645 RepID=UPI0011B0C7D7|nr:hypothetical protein [Paracoccus yeei]
MEDVHDIIAKIIVRDMAPEEIGFYEEIKEDLLNSPVMIEERILQTGDHSSVVWTAVGLVIANSFVKDLTEAISEQLKIGATEILKKIREHVTKKLNRPSLSFSEIDGVKLSKEKIDKIL